MKLIIMKRAISYDILVFMIVITLLVMVRTPYIEILLPFILIIIYSYKTQGLKISLGYSKPRNISKLIGTAFGLAIFIFFLSSFILLPAIEKLTETPLKLGVFQNLKNNSTLFFTSLLISWVVGGIIEETIFRGFIISNFIKHFNPKIGVTIGVILSSCLFGYMHSYQGISGQILIGIVGVLLAVIYIISKRNLWLNILTHGFVDTISMFILYFDLIN